MATIRQRGEKWQAQVRRLGQGALSRSFNSRKDAKAWAHQMEVLADQHDLNTQGKDKRVLQTTTLGELVRRYSDEISPRKRGRDTELIVLNAFARHPICSKILYNLHTQDFIKYRDERLKKIKPNTLKRQLSPIHNLFTVARNEWGLPIKDNPLDNLPLDKSDTKRERRLREGEWERFLVVGKSRKNPFTYCVMCFALETGMRRGEILAMRWEQLDKNNRCLLIPNTKNGHARTIPLSPKAMEVLEGQRAGPLLQDAAGPPEKAKVFPLSANALRLSWTRIKNEAGITDLRFHDLRHEAISRFFEKGLSVPEVALISGHRDARMLFRYTHPIREQITAKLKW